jgi:hypothetical protein
MFLFTVHSHVRPISGNGHRGEGPRGSPPCQRAPRVPQARQKYTKGVRCSHAHNVGVGRFDDVVELGRGENYQPRRLSRLRHFYKAGTEVGFQPRATDTPSVPLAGRFYRGPYDGALVDVQGALVHHPLGTMVY